MRASSGCVARLGAMLGIGLLLLLSAKRRSAAPLTNVSLLTRAQNMALLGASQRHSAARRPRWLESLMKA